MSFKANWSVGKIDTKHVGVIGAGVMGADMALDLSANGYQVTLVDVTEKS
ncbi:NAD(P)-binding domain-containing protein [Bacillus sp. SL00103]